ncbi:MAG: YbaB/EbfC family nucleoid-associated protein [Vulcanimicrobiota bacterium]
MQRQMMRKMQKMQQKLQASMGQIQEELADVTVEGTAGQGMVKVVVNGHQEIKSVKINPEVVDPEDVEMLEDLVLTAIKDAVEKSKELSSQKVSELTQGLPIPPGLL